MHHMSRGLAALALLAATTASAQMHGVKVTPLQRAPLSGDTAHEAVTASAVFESGGSTGRHSHPGDEYAVVIEGEVELRTEGQPPRRYRAGESYYNPRGLIHETANAAPGITRIIGTFVVDKNQPLVQPAP